MPSLAQSPAALTPQCLAMAALRLAAWTLLLWRNFSQSFRAGGGQGRGRLGAGPDTVSQGMRAHTKHCPAGAAHSKAVTLAECCWGLAVGLETSPF